MIEFQGTRRECFEWLRDQGFRRDNVGWHKRNWAYSLTHEPAGDFIGEVTDWDKPHFVVRAQQISVKLPRKKRKQDLDIPTDIAHIYSEEERSDQ
jgi:hypothetical protein